MAKYLLIYFFCYVRNLILLGSFLLTVRKQLTGNIDAFRIDYMKS